MLKNIFKLIVILATTSIFANDNFNNGFASSFDDEFENSYVQLYDPLSGYNRAMTNFNDGFYRNIGIPVARGYKKVVPQLAREGISNFFHNLLFPVRLVNNLLQFKFHNSATETSRFLINSTVGILGIVDVAQSKFNLEAKNEDLGQTLGYWGIGSGPHIVLPVLGNSNLRDMFGLVGDGYVNPISSYAQEDIRLTDNSNEFLAIKTFQVVNELSHNTEVYETITRDSIDLYILLRDSYEQRRNKLIRE